MAKQAKPKVGARVFWENEDGSREFGTIIQIVDPDHRLGPCCLVKWDTPSEYGEDETAFHHSPASSVKIARA